VLTSNSCSWQSRYVQRDADYEADYGMNMNWTVGTVFNKEKERHHEDQPGTLVIALSLSSALVYHR
jgi:hypothetical protein